MFREWGFLLGEIWVLLALAALIGLLAGWLIWGRRVVDETVIAAKPDTAEADRLRSALSGCEAGRSSDKDRIAALEAELAATTARLQAAAETAREAVARAAEAERADLTIPGIPAPLLATETVTEPAIEPVAAMSRPATLTIARDGKADDLKLIKGIGPKMEELCHRLGFFHFDQIAAWTPSELAWVDANLEDFKGRATRDNWIGQARDLAAGKPPLPGGEH